MYGLIGCPLGHSFSAEYFNDKFRKENIDESYRLFEIPSIDSLKNLFVMNPDLKGLNVTIPYKQEVIPFLKNLSEGASEIGAVNVIKVEPDGSLKGYNTDALGFIKSIEPMLGEGMTDALVLGTGGASKAIAWALRKLGIVVTFVSRKPAAGLLCYEELTPDMITRNKIIVNTTPLGMWPDIKAFPPIPYEGIGEKHLCFDLVYNPLVTEFMKRASQRGATVKNGLEMLHFQAEEAWKIWCL